MKEREKIMAKHNFIYLGTERGKRVIHKVGKTTQTCYARCASADYRIGLAFDLIFPTAKDSRDHSKRLSKAEKYIVDYFATQFKIEHGNEYFHCTKHKWEDIKPIFVSKMIEYCNREGYKYQIHEGWVSPNTY